MEDPMYSEHPDDWDHVADAVTGSAIGETRTARTTKVDDNNHKQESYLS
jgi:hypothetical protein